MSLVYQPPVLVATVGTSNNHNTAPKPRPGMYIGDKNDAKNYKMLVQRNITYILNVTPPKQVSYKTGVPNYFEHNNNNNNSHDSKSPSTLRYLRIPIYDSAISLTQLQDSIPSMVSFINQALQYQQSSILIHCQRGISRSVTVAIVYMIRCLDMSYHDAITMIQRRRPLAQPIPEFVIMLQQYEMTCRSNTTTMVAPGDLRPNAGTSIGTMTPEGGGEKVGDDGDNDTQRRLSTRTTGSNEKKRSIASATGSGIRSYRIVGPQRPTPQAIAAATTTTDDGDTTTTEYDGHNNKRRKKNESLVGPQRPPSI